MSIEINARRSLSIELKNYCCFSTEYDFIEATEWVNGSGWDIQLSSKLGTQNIMMTHGELQALNVLINYKEEN